LLQKKQVIAYKGLKRRKENSLMHSDLIPLTFDKVMQTRTYTVVVLASPSKKFAIYTDPNTGRILQMFLTGMESQRPLTHELIDHIFDGLNIHVRQVVINDIQEAIYFCRLFLEQEKDGILQIVEIDARPSDCMTLALTNNAPLFCTREALDKALPYDEI
jgi:bifunctional DNase/RNase